MAYRKIPVKFDVPEIVNEIGLHFRYGSLPKGSVKELAEAMGRSYENLRDILNGRYDAPILDLLHKAVAVTDGDPLIKKYLEPKGYELRKKSGLTPDKPTLAEECLDDVPALAKYHQVLINPKSKSADIARAKEKVVRELEENHIAWLEKRTNQKEA